MQQGGPGPHPGTLSLPSSRTPPRHLLRKPISPSSDHRLRLRGTLTNMPQRQDDGVEVTLGNQAPDSCPREREMA